MPGWPSKRGRSYSGWILILDITGYCLANCLTWPLFSLWRCHFWSFLLVPQSQTHLTSTRCSEEVTFVPVHKTHRRTADLETSYSSCNIVFACSHVYPNAENLCRESVEVPRRGTRGWQAVCIYPRGQLAWTGLNSQGPARLAQWREIGHRLPSFRRLIETGQALWNQGRGLFTAITSPGLKLADRR